MKDIYKDRKKTNEQYRQKKWSDGRQASTEKEETV